MSAAETDLADHPDPERPENQAERPKKPSLTQVHGDPEIRWQCEVHDALQLEVKFNYDIPDTPGPQIFEVGAYFFIPRNVGVNGANYTKDDFYGDVTALMRLDADLLPLDKLADPSFAPSPLHRLTMALESFERGGEVPASRPLAILVKLYAYLHTEAVRNEVRALRELIPGIAGVGPGRRAQVEKSFEQSLAELIARVRRSLQAFRTLRTRFWPYEPLCHQSMVEAMRWADEYMSLFLEERLGALTGALRDESRLMIGTGFVPRAIATINTLASQEAAHRRRYGFLTLETGSGDTGEYYAYRSSLLKKAVHNALYLDPRAVDTDTFMRNAVGAVGAALAAIWAFATSLPMAVAALSGNAKLGFFIAAVAAYVMKDRIKAFTNEYLTRRLKKYDHMSRIYGASLDAVGLGMMQADLREAMRFVPFHEVPEEVRKIRLERRTVRQMEATTEEVIHYRKSLKVQAKEEKERLPDGYSVRDILRFNVRHFLVRLDDPQEKIRYFDADKGVFVDTKIPKVYHLNVVLMLRQLDDHGLRRERAVHLRMVLNKNGIVRVEQIGGSGEETRAL